MEIAISTYGGDGHLGELFEGFCDGNGGIVVAGQAGQAGSGRGCVTNAVTGAAPLLDTCALPRPAVPCAIQRRKQDPDLAFVYRGELDHPLRHLYVIGSGRELSVFARTTVLQLWGTHSLCLIVRSASSI